MNSDFSKPKEKRIEEKERVEAEVERSNAVIKEKLAHAMIEIIEKGRRSDNVRSFLYRVDIHVKTILGILQILPPFIPLANVGFHDLEQAKAIIHQYRSIREDFKDMAKIGKEKLEILFPEIEFNADYPENYVAILNKIKYQEVDMAAYLVRY